MLYSPQAPPGLTSTMVVPRGPLHFQWRQTPLLSLRGPQVLYDGRPLLRVAVSWFDATLRAKLTILF